MTRIILADDHPIVSSGLAQLLGQLEWIEVLTECKNAAEVIRFTETNAEIDLVVTDLSMQEMSGLELTVYLKQHRPDIKVIVLSMHDEFKHVIACMEAGAYAYLLKNTDIEELVFAIKRVARGHGFICNELVQRMLKSQINHKDIQTNNDERNHYTARELEILNLIADGLTNAEISDKLFLSKRTIEGHRQNLLQKTNTSNTATMIRYAIKHGLIE